MVNLQPLSLWTVKKGEAESNEAEGRPNGTTPTGTWSYGMRVPLSSGEPIAKRNLPFRPPTHMLPTAKSPKDLEELGLQHSVEEVPAKMCTPEFREEFISLKRKSLGTATSTSNKMYMLRNSQVAVCRSGTPPRPISSPQQADPAGSNAACVPSWDGGQRVALGAGEAVSKHSQFGVPLNRKALFSTSSEVGSGKASWHPSTASSSTVLYPQVHSSSAFDLIPRFQVPLQRGIPMYPALLQSDTCGSNTPILCQVLLQRGTAMYPLPLWCDTPSNSIPLECQVPFQGGTPTSAVPLQYCTCSNNNLHQCAPLW